jgi:uncharacterized membrane protein YecN with MAPEG domain
MLAITGLYAAVLTALFLVMSIRVILLRWPHLTHPAEGSDLEKRLRMRTRARVNFSETAPLGLLLLGISELQGEDPFWLHLTGGLLTLGRYAQGLNFSFNLRQGWMWSMGVMLTISALSLGAVLALPF